MLKVVRTAVRLRHSIEADNELNARLDDAATIFDQAVLRGELPDPVTILGEMGETDADAA